MRYQTQMPFICMIFFSDIALVGPAQTKSLENKKKSASLGLSRIKYDIISKYSKPPHKMAKAGSRYRPQQQTELQNYRQTDISYFCLTRTYACVNLVL